MGRGREIKKRERERKKRKRKKKKTKTEKDTMDTREDTSQLEEILAPSNAVSDSESEPEAAASVAEQESHAAEKKGSAKAVKLSVEQQRVHRTTQLIKEKFGGSAYTQRYYEVLWAQNSKREPFWPAMIWDPVRVKGKIYNGWLKKTTGKADPGNFVIVNWLGYGQSFSVVSPTPKLGRKDAQRI